MLPIGRHCSHQTVKRVHPWPLPAALDCKPMHRYTLPTATGCEQRSSMAIAGCNRLWRLSADTHCELYAFGRTDLQKTHRLCSTRLFSFSLLLDWFSPLSLSLPKVSGRRQWSSINTTLHQYGLRKETVVETRSKRLMWVDGY